MAKLTEFKNPVNGQKGNLLDFTDITQMILGSAVFLGTMWAGEWLINEVKGTTGVNLQPSDPFVTPAATPAHNQKPAGPVFY